MEQNDNFYSMLTVAETLTMSSQLQLSSSTSSEGKASYVDNLISVLGLAKVKRRTRKATSKSGILGSRAHMRLLTIINCASICLARCKGRHILCILA